MEIKAIHIGSREIGRSVPGQETKTLKKITQLGAFMRLSGAILFLGSAATLLNKSAGDDYAEMWKRIHETDAQLSVGKIDDGNDVYWKEGDTVWDPGITRFEDLGIKKSDATSDK